MFRSFLAGMTVGGVAALLALQYHLVRTDDGLVVIPRVHQAPIRSAYVDTRSWTLDMWKNYPEVTEAVVQSGRGNLIVDKAARRIQEQPVPLIESSAFRSNREAVDALINVNRPAAEPRSPEMWLDPPPTRRLQDQKRSGIVPPLASLDSIGREVAAPVAQLPQLNPESRLVPIPMDIPAATFHKAPATEAAQPEVRDGKSWLLKLFQPANRDNSQADAEIPALPVPMEPVTEIASRWLEDENVFTLPREESDAGPPSPRQLR